MTDFIPCDDPSVAGLPLPEPHHDFDSWSRPRNLHPNDSHLFKVRVCRRCGQVQQMQGSPRKARRAS